MTGPFGEMTIQAVPGIPEIVAGDDLASILFTALSAVNAIPREHDILVVAQKIVSKAQGRIVDLRSVVPQARAQQLAVVTGKDPRLIELILSESTEVLRARPKVLIVRHRLGFVMANAGIDYSNVPATGHVEPVLLLPRDPDASAADLRAALTALFGVEMGVVISDSFGRPWRKGVVNTAIGAAGIPALLDRRGETDREGRALEVTEVAIADALAAAAGLMMGEAAEGVPAALIRGVHWPAPVRNGNSLVRPLQEDLFR
jgi:coenzyme F420-0:L-glutamate ligase/coenzyme F420-1:gamma-L-glutamate ligase